MNEALTVLAPALILLVIAVGTRFFPPSLGNAFLIKGPNWWSRDEQTWDIAYCYLAKRYAVLGAVLTLCCGVFYFLDWNYAPYFGFGLLLFFLFVAHFLTRKYMRSKE